MKNILCALFVVFIIGSTGVNATQPVVDNSFLQETKEEMTSKVCALTVEQGKTTTFSAEYFEKSLGLPSGDIRAITIASLPPKEQGKFFLDGVEVSLYDILLRSEVDRLCFAANQETTKSWFSFIPMCSKDICATISMNVSEGTNQSPILRNGLCKTAMGIPVKSSVYVEDNNGDKIALQVSEKPNKGQVTIDGCQYTYTPYQGYSGKDSFTITGIDNRGGVSNEATISVEIEKQVPKIRFADMNGKTSEYAAVKLCSLGVLTGEQFGTINLFYPEKTMTNGEYLVALLETAGMAENLEEVVNSGLKNDGDIALWVKPYVRVAFEKGIINDSSFDVNAVPSQLQAQKMAARTAEAKSINTSVPVHQAVLFNLNLNELPVWSTLTSNFNQLYYATSYTDKELTREVAAELLIALKD